MSSPGRGQAFFPLRVPRPALYTTLISTNGHRALLWAVGITTGAGSLEHRACGGECLWFRRRVFRIQPSWGG